MASMLQVRAGVSLRPSSDATRELRHDAVRQRVRRLRRLNRYEARALPWQRAAFCGEALGLPAASFAAVASGLTSVAIPLSLAFGSAPDAVGTGRTRACPSPRWFGPSVPCRPMRTGAALVAFGASRLPGELALRFGMRRRARLHAAKDARAHPSRRPPGVVRRVRE
jgi:hypothetical protein